MNFCRAVMMKIFTVMTPPRRGVSDHALEAARRVHSKRGVSDHAQEIRKGTMKFAVGHPPVGA